jgi:hypothetical protein
VELRWLKWMYFETKDPRQAKELRARSASRCVSVCLDIPVFDRNAGLSNALLLQLGIMLTLLILYLGLRP